MSSIWILACPLECSQWEGRMDVDPVPGRHAERLARVANRAACMTMGAKNQADEVQKNPFGENTKEKTAAHV